MHRLVGRHIHRAAQWAGPPFRFPVPCASVVALAARLSSSSSSTEPTPTHTTHTSLPSGQRRRRHVKPKRSRTSVPHTASHSNADVPKSDQPSSSSRSPKSRHTRAHSRTTDKPVTVSSTPAPPSIASVLHDPNATPPMLFNSYFHHRPAARPVLLSRLLARLAASPQRDSLIYDRRFWLVVQSLHDAIRRMRVSPSPRGRRGAHTWSVAEAVDVLDNLAACGLRWLSSGAPRKHTSVPSKFQAVCNDALVSVVALCLQSVSAAHIDDITVDVVLRLTQALVRCRCMIHSFPASTQLWQLVLSRIQDVPPRSVDGLSLVWQFGPNDVARFARSCEAAGIHSGLPITASRRVFEVQPYSLTPKSFLTLVTILSKTGNLSEYALRGAGGAFVSRADEFSPRQTIAVVWSLMLAGGVTPPVVDALTSNLQRFLADTDLEARWFNGFLDRVIGSTSLTQLYGIHLGLTFAGGHVTRCVPASASASATTAKRRAPSLLTPSAPAAPTPPSPLPSLGILTQCQAAYEDGDSHQSGLQRNVHTALKSMGLDPVLEFRTPEGVVMDIAWPEHRCAIEVDGPSHYLSPYQNKAASGERGLNPATLMTRSVLEGMGWEVSSLPYYVWNELKWDKDTREAYLRDRVPLAARLKWP